MNLVNDKWIPVIREDGSQDKIAPYQIAEVDNPVVDIAAPRPDFQGALYQFMIGLLQTTFAPEDQNVWYDLFRDPPPLKEIQKAIGYVADAFELYASDDEPAFLQEFCMGEGGLKSIAALQIEAPADKTCKDNLDHFNKRGMMESLCEGCTASALFTLQTNAPSGGKGHRVGLRGGGPLTTILLTTHGASSLWHKLWLNVLATEDFTEGTSSSLATVFPWMGEARTSEKGGKTTLPDDVHPLQMYWGMPRRIRLGSYGLPGTCSLCGEESGRLFSNFRTKNYGTNYEGPWVHPLTPYRFDPKKEKPPLSLKGQQGGLGYRHWLGMVWLDPDTGDHAALNIQSYNNEREFLLEEHGIENKIWCFGYDMDNMKARCWYEYQLPIIHFRKDIRPLFLHFTSNLVAAARDVVKELRTQVKAAWFSRPAENKGSTSMVDESFWQSTEAAFYEQLQILAQMPIDTRTIPHLVARQWLDTLHSNARDLFDHWVLEGNAEDMNMKRITKARRTLFEKLKKLRTLKALEQIANADKEVA